MFINLEHGTLCVQIHGIKRSQAALWIIARQNNRGKMPFTTSWDDVRLVSAVAESGSLVGAAQMLGINHSTVFRRLGALEKSLGSRLFERGRGGYKTTPAGDDMVVLANRISESVSDFERAVAGRDIRPAGILRITTNDTFIVHLLVPVFASFRTAYPEIVLDVIVTQQALNLSRRDADIAIRATAEPPETLVGRKLSNFGWSCYAPVSRFEDRSWINDKGNPATSASWVGYGEALNIFLAKKWLLSQTPAENIVCRFDTLVGVAQAISEGMGLGAIPCFIGDQIGNIRRVGKLLHFGDALWVLTHEDLRQAARVRSFMEHASAELGKQKKLIEGQ
jgi:DNA-binding transcriptional LysR family regulator